MAFPWAESKTNAVSSLVVWKVDWTVSTGGSLTGLTVIVKVVAAMYPHPQVRAAVVLQRHLDVGGAVRIGRHLERQLAGRSIDRRQGREIRRWRLPVFKTFRWNCSAWMDSSTAVAGRAANWSPSRRPLEAGILVNHDGVRAGDKDGASLTASMVMVTYR